MSAQRTTLEIDGKKVPFATNGAFAIIYRKHTGRDYYRDVATKCDIRKEEYDGCVFYDIAYVFAYIADPTIPPTTEEWAAQFSAFDPVSIVSTVSERFAEAMTPKKKSKAEARSSRQKDTSSDASTSD